MELIKYSETGIVHVSNIFTDTTRCTQIGYLFDSEIASGILGVCHVVKLGQDRQNNAVRQE